MFLSISILTTISLFIWTLVVTSFIVSNRHRHYTLTAGSVVLHIIIVIVIITILYFLFSINICMVTNIYSGTASGQALLNNEICVFSSNPSQHGNRSSHSRSRAVIVLVLSWLWDTQPIKVFLRC